VQFVSGTVELLLIEQRCVSFRIGDCSCDLCVTVHKELEMPVLVTREYDVTDAWLPLCGMSVEHL